MCEHKLSFHALADGHEDQPTYPPYQYQPGFWPSNPTFLPTPSQYGAPASNFLPYPSPAPMPTALPTLPNSGMPNPIILPPNPTATGAPAMMPGVFNPTFTPTTGFAPLMYANDSESEESVSSEEPVVPHDLHTHNPIIYSYHRGRSQRRSRGARCHSEPRYTPPVTYAVGCGKKHCDSHRCRHQVDEISLLSSCSSDSSGSGSSGTSSSDAHCHSRSCGRSSSRSRHDHKKKTSRRTYYPSEIYDSHSKPEPINVNHATPKHHHYFLWKARHFRSWADKAAKMAPITQSQAKSLYPRGVKLHPLLDKDTTTLFFNVLDSKKYITLQDGSSIVPMEPHHATCPPLIRMETVNWYDGTPVVLENPYGVTLGEVIDGILRNAHRTISNSEVKKWSDERLGIVYHWHWYNRARISGMRKHLTVGDTYGGHTAFEGLMTAQKAKKVDSWARGLPHCSMVLCLGMEGNIPGLRPISDFPR